VATRTVEPNDASGIAGAIYLWVEELNDKNVPSGLPISYQLAYTRPLAETIYAAQKRLNNGETVEGSLRKIEPQQTGASQLQSGSRSAFDVPPEWDLLFNGMPPVELPAKGIL
jgi:hypothetical protein